MSLRAHAISSVSWTTAAKAAQQVFQFGLSIVLMRMLGPKAFGLIGMVLVFSGFAAIFTDFGFSMALVQRRDLREEHRSTVFWVNMAVACFLTAVMFLAAGPIARFYKEPLLKSMSAWLSLTFILNAPGTVPRALLEKNLRFDVLAKIDVFTLAVSGLSAVAIAASGHGVWSLVGQQLVNATANSLALLTFGKWCPRLVWCRTALRELFRFGAELTGFNVINYWSRVSDNLLVGKFMGPDALGIYSRAYSLMLLPITQVISVLAPVMFPVFSTIQDDRDRVRKAFLRVIRLLTFITFPMMFGLMVVARPFVLGLLGAEWAAVIPLIQILAVVGMTQTLCNPVGWIYASQGRTDWLFWWGVGGSGFLIVSIVVGVLFGSVKSVAIAYLIGNLIITVPCLAIPGRLIDMKLGDVWDAIRGNLFCALAMGGCVWLMGLFLPPGMASLLKLAVEVTAGALVYVSLAYGSRQAVWGEILDVRQHFTSRRQEAVEPG